MKFSDFILTSTKGLILGLSILYIFSLVIVHLRAFLQPKISNHSISSEKPFKGYLKNLLTNIFTSLRLHLYTIQYLNPFSKISLPSIGNKKIDRWVIFLKTFNTYLVPFIVCGIVYLFFWYEIKGYLPIDLSNTTYSVIQEKLTLIRKHSVIDFLLKHKKWVNIFFTCLVILTILLVFSQKKIKKVQKILNQALIYIAILTNITFYSGAIASKYGQVEMELADMEMKIAEVHNRVYKKIEGASVYEYSESFEEKYEDYESLIDELNSYVIAHRVSLWDEDLGSQLDEELRKYIDTIETIKLVFKKSSEFKVPQATHRNFYNYYRNYQPTYNPKADYLFDKDKWTYQKGVDIEVEVDKKVNDIQQDAKIKFPKSHRVLKEVYSIISSTGIGFISDLLPDIGNDLVKGVLKSINKAFQADATKFILSFFSKENSNKQKQFKEEAINEKEIKNQYDRTVKRYYKESKKIYAEIEKIETRYKKIIRTEIENHIKSHNEKITFENVTFYDDETQQKITLTQEEKDALFKKRENLLQNFSIKDNKSLPQEYGNFVDAIYKEVINFDDMDDGGAYLNHLNQLSLGTISIKNKIKKIFQSTQSFKLPRICIRCGLNMDVVPICPIPVIR